MSDLLKQRLDTTSQVNHWVEGMKAQIAKQPLTQPIFSITHNPVTGYVITVGLAERSEPS